MQFLPIVLTHWRREKFAATSQTTFSNAFSWMKMYKIWLRFHWNLFPRGPINKIPVLVQIMALGWPSDKPLSEPTMVDNDKFKWMWSNGKNLDSTAHFLLHLLWYDISLVKPDWFQCHVFRSSPAFISHFFMSHRVQLISLEGQPRAWQPRRRRFPIHFLD